MVNIRETGTHKTNNINGNINCCIFSEEQFVSPYRKLHFFLTNQCHHLLNIFITASILRIPYAKVLKMMFLQNI